MLAASGEGVWLARRRSKQHQATTGTQHLVPSRDLYTDRVDVQDVDDGRAVSGMIGDSGRSTSEREPPEAAATAWKMSMQRDEQNLRSAGDACSISASVFQRMTLQPGMWHLRRTWVGRSMEPPVTLAMCEYTW